MLQENDAPAAELWMMAHLGTAMAIRVAATLRLADHLTAGHRTAAALAPLAGADPDALERLLRYLAARKVLRHDDAGGYQLTELGEALRDDHPSGLRAGLDIEGAGRAELAYVQLLHSIRTGDAAFEVQFGRTFWQDLADEPALTTAFNTLMGGDVPARARRLLPAYDWAALGHVVDVGGGDGSMLGVLLTAFPSLRGTLVDLPETARAAVASLAARGLADRCDVVEGSFFDPLPAGGGAYLLSWILHDWADGPAVAILRRCAEAAGPGGTVLIVEKTGQAGDTPHTGLDLRMLAYFGGKERGLAELTALAARAGLRVVAVHPAGAMSIVELTTNTGS